MFSIFIYIKLLKATYLATSVSDPKKHILLSEWKPFISIEFREFHEASPVSLYLSLPPFVYVYLSVCLTVCMNYTYLYLYVPYSTIFDSVKTITTFLIKRLNMKFLVMDIRRIYRKKILTHFTDA